MGDIEQPVIRLINSLKEVAAADWDACANPQDVPRNPFLSHAFLYSLEESGSATPRTGWAPHHLVLEDPAGGIAACAPMYLKNHSQGEYVFDHGWADAYERAGGAYYPKLQISVPFTPVTGRRLLVRPGPGAEAAEHYLVSAMIDVAEQIDASSFHLTFLDEAQWTRLGQLGLLQRTDQQFHWYNHSYASFENFLAELSSRKRKMIRKERERATENGIEIEWVTGRDLTEHHWDAFFAFYMDTGSRKWGRPYLTRLFFSLIGERMADDILLIMAKRNGRYIAGALNFIGGDALYGRNWGALEHHPFLHFECCYYQAIDFAITHGLKRVEAGAQGEHKLARGYLPSQTFSAHWIANASFRNAVSAYLTRERDHIDRSMEFLGEYSPFRKGDTHHEDEF